jgi:hypothetical protein
VVNEHVLRAARPGDAEAVVRVHREARREAMPWLPELHTPAEDVDFFPARNERAYEERGFRLVELTDGSGNEEREPDARYVCPA